MFLRWFHHCLLLFWLSTGASGCAGGAAAVIWALISSSGNSGGAIDEPPAIVALPTPTFLETPDRILVEYRISNDDKGRLGARIEYEVVEGGQASGLHAQATPAPGSEPLEGIDVGSTVRFVWDAGKDLEGDCKDVRITVTPIEDGKDGVPDTTATFRAGNTPVAIQDVKLSQSADVLFVSFVLVDQESDRIDLVGLDLSIDGGPFLPLPPETFEKLRKDFPSGPGPAGAQGVLNFSMSREPGFFGDLKVRISMRDFSSEEPAVCESKDSFRFDNNEPPVVEILPILEEDLSSGVIPIRYRIFDKELNPASIEIEVDLGDGKGFQPANEFPMYPSKGRTNLYSIPLSDFGDPEMPFQTFLWDAFSQVFGEKSVNIAARASSAGSTSSPSRIP